MKPYLNAIRRAVAMGGLAATSLAAPSTWSERLRAEIAAFPGTVSLFAKNLDTGASFGIEEDRPVRTASTIKLPILAAVYAAVASGRARWADPLELTDANRVSGSGVARELSAGLRLPLRDVANLMIVVSDNTATNMILDHIGADFVNEQMARLGLEQTRSMRKIRGDGADLKDASGFSAEGRKPENARWGIGRSTPREMVALLEKIETGELDRQMIATLKRQQYKDGIGRFLPYTVASKSGALDALRSDAGIVWAPGGRLAIAITVDGMRRIDYSPENAGNKLIGRLSVLLTEGLAQRIKGSGSAGPPKPDSRKPPARN